MNWNEALDYVEYSEFAAYVNVASHLQMFLAIASDNAAVRLLRTELRDANRVAELASRAYQRAQEPFDPRYENRWDVPLAVYLWLLDWASGKYAMSVAYSVLSTPQCWWARQLARRIVSGAHRDEGTTDVPVGESASLGHLTNLHATESILTAVRGVAENIRFLVPADIQQLTDADMGAIKLPPSPPSGLNFRTNSRETSLEPVGAR